MLVGLNRTVTLLLAHSVIAANGRKPLLFDNTLDFPLQQDVTISGLMQNLQALNDIAQKYGGNRAFGLPGYSASVDYILSQTNDSSDATVWTQNFSAPFNQIVSTVFQIGETKYNIGALRYSPSTNIAGLRKEIILGPGGIAACTANAYKTIDIEDKIVLIERNNCPDRSSFSGIVSRAADAKAAAVIIYDNNPYPFYAGSLRSTNSHQPKLVPAAVISQADGRNLVQYLGQNSGVVANFQHTQINEPRISQNVFAETKTGDPKNIIMLGAHLDSVQAGPGINDDGSGVTLLLELFRAIQKYDFKNKIRFAWWGAEENGLIGSNHYTGGLNASEAVNIVAYLNFDMIARGYFGIFDGTGSRAATTGPPGSEIFYRLFYDAFLAQGINNTRGEKFSGNSDYGTFVAKLKTPSGGLHTGAGYAQDPCYHRKCDTIHNIDPFVLNTNAQVTARVLSILAMQVDTLLPKRSVINIENSNKYIAPLELRGNSCGGHNDI